MEDREIFTSIVIKTRLYGSGSRSQLVILRKVSWDSGTMFGGDLSSVEGKVSRGRSSNGVYYVRKNR